MKKKTIKNKTPVNPCPFCGALPKSRLIKIAVTKSGVYGVVCLRCGGCGPRSPDFEEAIKLWNTASMRTVPTTLSPFGMLRNNKENVSVGVGMCLHVEMELKEVRGKRMRLWTPILCDKCINQVALFREGACFCGHDKIGIGTDGNPMVVRGKKCVCGKT